MKDDDLDKFNEFLKTFVKKNGKGLGERTIKGILILAKFIDIIDSNKSLEELKNKYEHYLKSKHHPIALYALWLYLKSKSYDDKIIKEIATFKKRNISAVTDEEKLAKSVLSKKELIFLVNSISKPRDKLILCLLYDTGARISEITNLKLKDVDLETKEVQVMGKGRKPRTVYFQKITRDMLSDHIKYRKVLNPNEPIFKLKPCTVWFNLKKYGREILSRDLHPHMLRHTRLQHMADEGIDSFAIKAYAGHATLTTTEIYVKSSKRQGKLAFEKAGDLWEENKKKEQKTEPK